MENLHLKNLDMSKILKKIKPNDDYIDEEDDNDFEYDDEDDSWEWTDKDEEEFRKYRRHLQQLYHHSFYKNKLYDKIHVYLYYDFLHQYIHILDNVG